MKRFLFLSLILLLCPIFACLPADKVLATDAVDINTASLSQLDKIAHIGDKTAQKIIDSRPYSSVQDLSRVKGIGNGKYLQDIISQGVACINCVTQIDQTKSLDAQTQNTNTTDQTQTPAPTVTYPVGVIFNELLPNPSGADETEEWFEIFNYNNFDVDLSGWQIKDIAGTITTFTIPKDTKISANGFFVFKRPDTKIMLNNDGDGLNLFWPDGTMADSIAFTNAPLGQSYNLPADKQTKPSGWVWSTTLTPGSKNIITAAQTKNLAKC